MTDGPFKSSKVIPHWLDFISCCWVVEPLATSQSFISKKSGLHIVSRIFYRIPLQTQQFFFFFFFQDWKGKFGNDIQLSVISNSSFTFVVKMEKKKNSLFIIDYDQLFLSHLSISERHWSGGLQFFFFFFNMFPFLPLFWQNQEPRPVFSAHQYQTQNLREKRGGQN